MGEEGRREALAELRERLPAKHIEFLRKRGQQRAGGGGGGGSGAASSAGVIASGAGGGRERAPASPAGSVPEMSPPIPASAQEPRLGLGGELRGWGDGMAGLEPMARDMLRTDGDPEGEGYTLEDLAALSVSRVAAQRAAAVEILGKFLEGGQDVPVGPAPGRAGASVRAAQEWALGPGGLPRILRRSLADPSPRVRAAALNSLLRLAELSCPPVLLSVEALCPSLCKGRPVPVGAMRREGGRGAWRPLFRPRQPGEEEDSGEASAEEIRRDPLGFLVLDQALAPGVVQAVAGLDEGDGAAAAGLAVLGAAARHSPGAAAEVSSAGAATVASAFLARALGSSGVAAAQGALHAVRLLRLLWEGGFPVGAEGVAQVKLTLHKYLSRGPDGQEEGAALVCAEVFRLWGRFLWVGPAGGEGSEELSWSADELWPLLQQILQTAVATADALDRPSQSAASAAGKVRVGAELLRCFTEALQKETPGLSAPCAAAVLDEATACLEAVVSCNALGDSATWPLVSAALEYTTHAVGGADSIPWARGLRQGTKALLSRSVEVVCQALQDGAEAQETDPRQGRFWERDAARAELTVAVLRTSGSVAGDAKHTLVSLSAAVSHRALESWPASWGTDGLSEWRPGSSGEDLKGHLRRALFFLAVSEAQVNFPEAASADLVIRLPTLAPPGEEARVRCLIDTLMRAPSLCVDITASVVSAWKETWVPEGVRVGLCPLPPEWPLIGLSEVQAGMGAAAAAAGAHEEELRGKLTGLLRCVVSLDSAGSGPIAQLPEALKVAALIPQVFLASGSLFLEEEVQLLAGGLFQRWVSPRTYSFSAKAWFGPEEAADLCEAFCATSFGDKLFGKCVALCLARNESGATVRGSWNALRDNLGLHLLPRLSECLLGAEAYDWSPDEPLVFLFAESLANGDLDRALATGSVASHVAVESVARACFPDGGERASRSVFQSKVLATLTAGKSRAWQACLPVSEGWRSLLAPREEPMR